RPGVEHAAEAARIEAFDWSRDPLVRLDAAAAVNRPARIGVLQIGRIMRFIGILVAERVAQVLVEARVPRTLNETSARCVVMRGGQRQTGVAADAIDRLDERLAKGRLADDVGAIVIL